MKLTQEQQDWILFYYKQTDFDCLWLDMVESGEISFEEFARKNVEWYESHSGDVLNRIGHFPKSEEFWNSL